jgi:two-component sensor histidine kinase
MTIAEYLPESRVPSVESLLLVEEITHRVINEYTIAILSIDSEAACIVDADTRAALGRAAARLHAHVDAHRALQPPAIDGEVNMGKYLARLCAALSAASLTERGVRLALIEDDIDLAPERCWRVGLIVSELITNAVRHGFKGGGGMIAIDVRLVGVEVVCQVADNGGSAPNPAPSRGRRVVGRLAQDLGGDVSWRFGAQGVTAILSFPLCIEPLPSPDRLSLRRPTSRAPPREPAGTRYAGGNGLNASLACP